MMSAGELVRVARRRAGLTQAELGLQAGVTQSVVSAYELGARQPSMPMLARLVSATGAELRIELSEPAGAPAQSGALAHRVRDRRVELLRILARYGLRNARLFGSVARGDEGPESDVDLLVDVPEGVGLVTLGRCQAEVEALLGVRVDLVPASDLKATVAAEALRDAVPL